MAAQSALLRREQTARAITRCAQDLAIEHGFEGFTLDELAELAGVSRRTLFNYFPGKEAAVLGAPEHLDDEDVAVFVAGGPRGHLLHDLATLVVAAYLREEPTRADWQRMHALFERNPRLINAAHLRFEGLVTQVRAATERREGLPPGHQRARVAVAIIGGLFHESLAAFLKDEDAEFPAAFLAGVDEATTLLA